MKNGIAIRCLDLSDILEQHHVWKLKVVIKRATRWRCCGKKKENGGVGGAQTSEVSLKLTPFCVCCQCLSAWTDKQQLLDHRNRAEVTT